MRDTKSHGHGSHSATGTIASSQQEEGVRVLVQSASTRTLEETQQQQQQQQEQWMTSTTVRHPISRTRVSTDMTAARNHKDHHINQTIRSLPHDVTHTSHTSHYYKNNSQSPNQHVLRILSNEMKEKILSILPQDKNGSNQEGVSLSYLKANVNGFVKACGGYKNIRLIFETNMGHRITIYNSKRKGKRYFLRSSSPTCSNSNNNNSMDHANTKLPDYTNKSGGLLIDADSGTKYQVSSRKNNMKRPKKVKVCRVCIAQDNLVQMIQEHQSLKRSYNDDNEFMDMPKEMIKSLPFYKNKQQEKIILVTSPSASDAAVASIRKELYAADTTSSCSTTSKYKYVGLDTETRPKFQKGNLYPPALLQIATSTTAYLFRLTYENELHTDKCPMTKSLHALLADPFIIKVGVGIDKDMVEMKQFYGSNCGGDGSSYLDLRDIVNIRWPKLRRRGLRPLTATVLKCQLNKSQRMADWGKLVYSTAMEKYAANDAFVSLDLLNAIIESPP
mmetsp:Transcript_7426/g.14040  ORF Transcript_7426/g.14040 Transcript_7426/m.14040 type:complete len:503 (+) Transcript_7426:123-1631(+)